MLRETMVMLTPPHRPSPFPLLFPLIFQDVDSIKTLNPILLHITPPTPLDKPTPLTPTPLIPPTLNKPMPLHVLTPAHLHSTSFRMRPCMATALHKHALLHRFKSSGFNALLMSTALQKCALHRFKTPGFHTLLNVNLYPKRNQIFTPSNIHHPSSMLPPSSRFHPSNILNPSSRFHPSNMLNSSSRPHFNDSNTLQCYRTVIYHHPHTLPTHTFPPANNHQSPLVLPALAIAILILQQLKKRKQNHFPPNHNLPVVHHHAQDHHFQILCHQKKVNSLPAPPIPLRVLQMA